MLAVAGAGIACVSRFAVAQELKRGELELVLPQSAANDNHAVHALFAGGATMPARVRALVDFLAEKNALNRRAHVLRGGHTSETAGTDTATVNAKGQITIPFQVRATLGLRSGDEIEFVDLENGQFAIVAVSFSVKRLKGMIRKRKVIVSIDDINPVFALKE